MALLVLGDLCIAIGRQVAHDDRNLKTPGTNRSAQPLGAEVDTAPAISIGEMYDEGLQDAALLNVRSEFSERVQGGTRCAGCFGSS